MLTSLNYVATQVKPAPVAYNDKRLRSAVIAIKYLFKCSFKHANLCGYRQQHKWEYYTQ